MNRTSSKKETAGPQHGPHLPAFAAFILDHHLEEFVKTGLRLSRELDIPIMKHFQMPEEQLIQLSMKGSGDLLKGLAEGKQEEMINKSMERWEKDELPGISQDQIHTDDLTLVSYVRKQNFMAFLTRYTEDTNVMLSLVRELDEWMLKSTSRSFKTYVRLLQERIAHQVEQLRQSDELFKQAQAVTHIGNYIWEPAIQKLNWSDELYRIYGLDPKEGAITNEIVAGQAHPDDVETTRLNVRKSMETQTPFDFHYRIIMRNGSVKILHARGDAKSDAQGQMKIFGTAQDVTHQKAIERSLEENQRFIKKIADAAPAIITSYNINDGKYAFVSHGIKPLLGYEPELLLREGVSFAAQLVHPDDLPVIMKKNQLVVEAANQQGRDQNEEVIAEFVYRMRHANGEYRWFHTFGTVFSRDVKGLVESVLNISLDITEKVKAEEILLQTSKELQQSNANLQEFAFIASHDLKEPLRKISTLSDRLQQTEKANFSEQGKVYLDKVISAALRMQQMVDDLLSLSQVSVSTHFEKTSLNQILLDVLQTFESRIEALHARVDADTLPEAEVIPAQFRQLFQNLISNSLKFAKKDLPPVITIKSEFIHSNGVDPDAKTSASRYLQLTFLDNGIGFDNRFVEKIFAIFQRLHSRAEYEGTGIGLAICRKIVENHGGTMNARGTPGLGAEFVITLPAGRD